MDGGGGREDHLCLCAHPQKQTQTQTQTVSTKTIALGGDLLIAAVAAMLDASVVTRNVGDSERFESVSVETY